MLNLGTPGRGSGTISFHDYNRKMIYAVEEGHKEFVLLMLEKGATDYNYGINDAVRYDHEEIAEIIQRWAKEHPSLNQETSQLEPSN